MVRFVVYENMCRDTVVLDDDKMRVRDDDEVDTFIHTDTDGSVRVGDVRFRSKYPIVIFENCDRVRVHIQSKVLRVMFVRCTNMVVHMDADLVGPLEWYACTHSDVHVNGSAPIVTLENCSRMRVTQCTPVQMYLAHGVTHTLFYKSARMHEIDTGIFNTRRIIEMSSTGVRTVTLAPPPVCDPNCATAVVIGSWGSRSDT